VTAPAQRAPDWPDVTFAVDRMSIVLVGGTADDAELVNVFQEARVAVIAETMIGGRLAYGLAVTDPGTALRLTDEEAIALKRDEVLTRLDELARAAR
jgi:hypothetical protein